MGRDEYPHFLRIETRWADNDVYGHINNPVYYSFFDTAVNRFLLDRGVLDLSLTPAFGVVVETGSRFASSLAFPAAIDAGLRVAKLRDSGARSDPARFR